VNLVEVLLVMVTDFVSNWVRKIDYVHACVGSVVKKFDFVKLILAKTGLKLNVKWFMFGYIHVKVTWTKKVECKTQL
jgi:hypothetical protein